MMLNFSSSVVAGLGTWFMSVLVTIFGGCPKLCNNEYLETIIVSCMRLNVLDILGYLVLWIYGCSQWLYLLEV